MSFGFATVALAATVIHHSSGWQEIRPGGETRCALGAEYAFFVRPGDPDKLSVDFIGGGACWDALTCSPQSTSYTKTVDALRDRAASGELPGIYDDSAPDNPLAGFTRVVVPYCTGDVHWGASDVTYRPAFKPPFTVYHRGAINAKAALDWARDNVTDAPRQLSVTGCSAGSYGSIYWLPRLREQYPNARVTQLGDAGVGVMTSSFGRDVFPSWNVTAFASRSVPGTNPDLIDWKTLTLTDFYSAVAKHYPEVDFAQYSTTDDRIQKFFYTAMGGRSWEWTTRMLKSLDALDKLPNFSSYVASGDSHCATVSEDLFSISSDGIKLVDWMSAHVGGEDPAPVRP